MDLKEVSKVKVYLEYFCDEAECYECRMKTYKLYVLASSREEAESLLAEGKYFCGDCMAEMLSKGYEIRRSNHARS